MLILAALTHSSTLSYTFCQLQKHIQFFLTPRCLSFPKICHHTLFRLPTAFTTDVEPVQHDRNQITSPPAYPKPPPSYRYTTAQQLVLANFSSLLSSMLKVRDLQRDTERPCKVWRIIFNQILFIPLGLVSTLLPNQCLPLPSLSICQEVTSSPWAQSVRFRIPTRRHRSRHLTCLFTLIIVSAVRCHLGTLRFVDSLGQVKTLTDCYSSGEAIHFRVNNMLDACQHNSRPVTHDST